MATEERVCPGVPELGVAEVKLAIPADQAGWSAEVDNKSIIDMIKNHFFH
jgi:hypothetical protein